MGQLQVELELLLLPVRLGAAGQVQVSGRPLRARATVTRDWYCHSAALTLTAAALRKASQACPWSWCRGSVEDRLAITPGRGSLCHRRPCCQCRPGDRPVIAARSPPPSSGDSVTQTHWHASGTFVLYESICDYKLFFI